MHPTRSVTQPRISSNSIWFYNILLKCGSKIKINPKNVNCSIKENNSTGTGTISISNDFFGNVRSLRDVDKKKCCRHINGFQMAIWQFLPELSFAVWSNQQQSTSTKCWFAITSINAGSPHEKPKRWNLFPREFGLDIRNNPNFHPTKTRKSKTFKTEWHEQKTCSVSSCFTILP